MSIPEWAAAPARTEQETVTLSVNGARRTVTTRSDTPLLYLLRNHFGLKGSRFGCGLGQCGACMVLLDGHATPSCDLPAWAVDGHEVVTVEGLSEDDGPAQVQQAFETEQAAQCGYCMSGILISATALLRANPHPSEREVREALDGNLCRCGAHIRVIRAILRAAEESR
jgi:nicotinate dehydrogenase subunit A